MGEYLVEPERFNTRSTYAPQNPLEALMQAPPGAEPAESQEEMLARRADVLKLLDGAWDQLDPIEREIVDAVVFEKASLRTIAARYEGRYGKTWIAHLRDQAFDKLRNYLEDHGFSPAKGEG